MKTIKINDIPYLVVDNRIVNYSPFNNDINEEYEFFDEVGDYYVPDNLTIGKYGIVNGKIVELGYTEATIGRKKEYLRSSRPRLLMAFDKYKSNINYGVINETLEERNAIIEWYNGLLELEEESFVNIPEKIKYYL